MTRKFWLLLIGACLGVAASVGAGVLDAVVQSVTINNTTASPANTLDANSAAILTQITKDAAANAPFTSDTPMTAGTTYPAGRSIVYVCTVAGTEIETLAGGTAGTTTTLSRNVSTGPQQLPDSVVSWTAGTATCSSVVNLY